MTASCQETFREVNVIWTQTAVTADWCSLCQWLE